MINIEKKIFQMFEIFCNHHDLANDIIIRILFEKFKENPLININNEIRAKVIRNDPTELKHMQNILITLMNYTIQRGEYKSMGAGCYLKFHNPFLFDFYKYGAYLDAKSNKYIRKEMDDSITFADLQEIVYKVFIDLHLIQEEPYVKNYEDLMCYKQESINNLFEDIFNQRRHLENISIILL